MRQESSLDRFLKSRAVVGLGLGGRRVTLMQSAIGGVMGLLGIGALLAPTMGAIGDIRGAAFGLLCGATAMLVGSQVMRRKLGTGGDRDWRLTPEAKALVLKLVRKQLGWWDANAFDMQPLEPGLFISIGSRRNRRVLRGIAWDSGETSWNWFKDPAAPISQDVLLLLELAAEQYNKIQGILQTPASSLSKIASQALTAADEAMADILHDAATMDRFPESGQAAVKQIEKEIAGLRELAERLEDLAIRDLPMERTANVTTAMESVLEELRLEQAARHELHDHEPEIRQNA